LPEVLDCLESYILLVDDGQSVVCGIFRNDRLHYALEIVEGEIEQLSGKTNSSPPEEVKIMVKKYIKIN